MEETYPYCADFRKILLFVLLVGTTLCTKRPSVRFAVLCYRICTIVILYSAVQMKATPTGTPADSSSVEERDRMLRARVTLLMRINLDVLLWGI
jgi:hypothetical protein